MRGLRAVLVGTAVAFASARATTARADPPAVAARDVIVVEVDAGSSGVDGARLRKAIGDELGADAVEPDDGRSVKARGTIGIRIDSDAGTLVVSYREKGAPIVRKIDLPATAEATMHAAVLLAGNLARDEASELAQMLRRRTPPAKPPAGELGADDLIEQETAADPSAGPDLAEAKATLDRHTQHHRTLRTALGWSLGGAGLALEATSLYLLLIADRGVAGDGHQANLGIVLLGVGGGLATASAPVLPSGRLDELERYFQRDVATGRPPQAVRDDLETQWLYHARTERKWRRVSLVASGVVLALGAGLTTFMLVGAASSGSSLTPTTATEALFVPFYVGFAAPSVALAVGPGPVEDALRDYERVTGRRVLRDGGLKVDPVVSPTAGGGVVGLSGRF